jgi:ADP-ribose pyrophosphatase YjhB (NUDIX family)
LIREFREETGLEVRRPTLLGVTSDVRRRDNGDKIHTVRILFTVELAGGELHHEVHGTTDHAAWFDLTDIDSMNIAEYAQKAIASAQGK